MFVGATKRWKHHFCTIALFVENHLLRLGAQNFEVVPGCFLRDKACTIGLLRRRLDNLLPGSLSIGTGSSMASLRRTETSNSNATTVGGTNHLDLIGTSRGGLDHPEEIHGIDGSSTEHLDLIGTSRGGLDHPEEIHGIDSRGTEHLDLIGTSRGGLNYLEEIHEIDGSGTDKLVGHRSHSMAAVGGRDDGFFAALGGEDDKCL